MNSTKLYTELHNLEKLADLLWEQRQEPENFSESFLSSCDYEYSEGLKTDFSRILGVGLENYSSREEILGDLVEFSRSPQVSILEEEFSYAEDEGKELNPEVVNSLLRKIISSVYSGKEANVTELKGMDGKPLTSENQFGFDSESGTIRGMFKGMSGGVPDPIEFTIDGNTISYGTAKQWL